MYDCTNTIMIIVLYYSSVYTITSCHSVLSVQDYHYKQHRFPPTLCISNGATWFYSVTIIVNILVAIGTYLLYVIFWIIHHVIYNY